MDLEWSLIVRYLMALVLFSMGLAACVAGLMTLLASEYRRTLRGIADHTNRLHARALGEVVAGPAIDASARLIEAVNQLVRTAMGVGAFLCLIGVVMCAVAVWVVAL